MNEYRAHAAEAPHNQGKTCLSKSFSLSRSCRPLTHVKKVYKKTIMRSLFSFSPQPITFLLLFLHCYAKEIFILFLMWTVYKIFAMVPSRSSAIAVYYHCYFYDLHMCSLFSLQHSAKNCHPAPRPTKELYVTVLSVSCVLWVLLHRLLSGAHNTNL
jgi:hypothetical protein